ncbi:FtsK/SpoIIIE domain-containing protein [Microcella alkaliphila]|uniref:Putative cell division-related protein n=1 Tax=Microcella alkaliphila TaxID=279828 RepID=A0A0U5BDL1_9MICO|nr:FtsK/SpoIIIE domain-containing protein [Microcella alkaliphila]BAU32673.1 putative cell division-related protein [Microcella alkaliphila]
MTITYPEPPRASPRAPFPVIAVIAPLIAAVVIGAIIRSPYVLVFAALSPIIAVASALESRRAARRHAREEDKRFALECAATEHAIERAHRDETERAFATPPGDGGSVVGAAPGASTIAGSAPTVDAHPEQSVRERLRALHARAARNPRLPVRVPPGPVEVHGSGFIAERLRARLGDRAVPDGSPSDGRARTTISVSGLARLDIVLPGGERVAADAVVSYLADEEARNARARAAALPERCEWAAARDGQSTPGLAVGLGAAGTVTLDLITDGPHVLVGGATGSGKSEFLRALALSAAADPGAWSVLYVDFKGGATFQDLAELPSTVGVITDLDAVLATRALTSLRAEIERRERVLARERVRDIAQLASGLSRLLIVVDEYAALVATHPALQAVFSDLSARGRSLGIHLVLCTQRPSGVVHDTVAVNCAIRVLFRTTDAADARALLGGDAPSVAAAPRGRAVIRTSEQLLAAQVGLVAPADIAAVASAASSARADPPWAPVLPSELSPTQPEVVDGWRHSRAEGSLLVGLIDDVAAQRWSAASWHPRRDGALAILGCSGSGRTTALAQLAAEARQIGWEATLLPHSLADAHQVLTDIASGSAASSQPQLLLVDGLADLIDAESPEHATQLLARLDAALRALHQRGGGAAVAVGTASSAGRLLAGRFGARLQLRALDCDDHHASGAPRGEHNDRAPAGRGWWRGQPVQVVQPTQSLPPALPPRIRTVGSEPVIAVVSANPDRSLEALRASCPRPVRGVPLAALVDAASRHDVRDGTLACVGHPDDWQRDWAAFAHARREAVIAFDGCDMSDLRALVSARIQPPPIDQRDLWVIEPGGGSTPEVLRARWSPPSSDVAH